MKRLLYTVPIYGYIYIIYPDNLYTRFWGSGTHELKRFAPECPEA